MLKRQNWIKETQLHDELQRAIAENTKLQEDLTENDMLINNMLTTIKTLSQDNEIFIEELKEMRNDNLKPKK
ncbi:hypothetical protein JTB14_027830 [Gonioctena quinquepunctata]|nr:hypothetical protein JTB14_027830 [Gonioctena quinquepunctata]